MQQEKVIKQTKLKECIKEMSEKSMESKDIDKMIERLRNIYGDSFRHSYADFFNWILEIKKEKPGAIELLSMNLGEIENKIEENTPNNKDEFKKQINKLVDHINLEISRINHIVQREEEVIKLTDALESAKNSTRIANRKAASMQKEYVAILGIFASIVVTFTGGLTFTTSALETINNDNLYRAILVCLVVGLVLVNALYGLFYYINKIVNAKNEENIENTNEKDDDKQIIRQLRTANWTFALLILGVGLFYIVTLIYKTG